MVVAEVSIVKALVLNRCWACPHFHLILIILHRTVTIIVIMDILLEVEALQTLAATLDIIPIRAFPLITYLMCPILIIIQIVRDIVVMTIGKSFIVVEPKSR